MMEVGFQEDRSIDGTETNARTTFRYTRTIPGLLKIIEILFSLLCVICIVSNHKGTYFCLVSLGAVVITALLLFFHHFRVSDQYDSITWHNWEFAYYALCAIQFLVASALITKYKGNLYITAAVFGFAAMMAYVADAFFKWQAMHGCVIASDPHPSSDPRRNHSEESM